MFAARAPHQVLPLVQAGVSDIQRLLGDGGSCAKPAPQKNVYELSHCLGAVGSGTPAASATLSAPHTHTQCQRLGAASGCSFSRNQTDSWVRHSWRQEHGVGTPPPPHTLCNTPTCMTGAFVRLTGACPRLGRGDVLRASCRPQRPPPRSASNMSELFDGYAQEYCDLSGAITCAINELQSGSGGKGKDAEIVKKMKALQEALRNMEVELAALPSAKKMKLTVRLQNFQKDAANLKKEFEKAKTAAGDPFVCPGHSCRAGPQTCSLCHAASLLCHTQHPLNSGRRLETDQHWAGASGMMVGEQPPFGSRNSVALGRSKAKAQGSIRMAAHHRRRGVRPPLREPPPPLDHSDHSGKR